uniref:Tetratricopeptide repeat protein 7B n=1 Tax=Lygus hesperus TaxID=30085 RepID=A0A0A9ZG54_LYGHE
MEEATNINPLSHQRMHARGLVHEKKNQFTKPNQCFHNAISVISLQYLGLMCHYLENQRIAEKMNELACAPFLIAGHWRKTGRRGRLPKSIGGACSGNHYPTDCQLRLTATPYFTI